MFLIVCEWEMRRRKSNDLPERKFKYSLVIFSISDKLNRNQIVFLFSSWRDNVKAN